MHGLKRCNLQTVGICNENKALISMIKESNSLQVLYCQFLDAVLLWRAGLNKIVLTVCSSLAVYFTLTQKLLDTTEY